MDLLQPTHTQLAFREIVEAPELLRLLRLRHLTYSHQGYWEPQSQRFDLDSYDRHSRFVGAYVQSKDGNEELIGGARFIQEEGEPHASTVDQIIREESVEAPPARQFDFTAQALMDFAPITAKARAQNRRLVEFGRTVIHPDWQGSGLGQQLVFALYGLALNSGIDLGLALVPPRLVSFYARCGCRPMPADNSTYYGHTELVPVEVDLRQLPVHAPGAVSETLAARQALTLKDGEWKVEMAFQPRRLVDPGILVASVRNEGVDQSLNAGLGLHTQGLTQPATQ